MKQKATRRLPNLFDPSFLLALALLLLNDHLWKAAFHNTLTGKLSDFAGLYAFTWIGLALLSPRKTQTTVPATPSLLTRPRTLWPIFAGLFFIWWKSPLSQPAIDTWNTLGWINMGRTIDYTDWIALVMIPLAAVWFQRKMNTNAGGPALEVPSAIQKLAHWTILSIALFAFVATSGPTDIYVYNETYDLPVPPQQVLDKLNAINQSENLGNPTLSLHLENANDFREERDIRLYLHHNKERIVHFDTILAHVEGSDSNIIHEIRPYEVPAIDSMYLNPDGIFEWRFDVRSISEDSMPHCHTLPAMLRLESSGKGSKLELIRIPRENCHLVKEKGVLFNQQDILKAAFQEEVIQPLKELKPAQ
jgi:hypothetical protein